MIFSLTWEMVSQLRTFTGTASVPSSCTITLTVCRGTQGEESVWGPRSLAPRRESSLGHARGHTLGGPYSTQGSLTWPFPHKPWLSRTEKSSSQDSDPKLPQATRHLSCARRLAARHAPHRAAGEPGAQEAGTRDAQSLSPGTALGPNTRGGCTTPA